MLGLFPDRVCALDLNQDPSSNYQLHSIAMSDPSFHWQFCWTDATLGRIFSTSELLQDHGIRTILLISNTVTRNLALFPRRWSSKWSSSQVLSLSLPIWIRQSLISFLWFTLIWFVTNLWLWRQQEKPFGISPHAWPPFSAGAWLGWPQPGWNSDWTRFVDLVFCIISPPHHVPNGETSRSKQRSRFRLYAGPQLPLFQVNRLFIRR